MIFADMKHNAVCSTKTMYIVRNLKAEHASLCRIPRIAACVIINYIVQHCIK